MHEAICFNGIPSTYSAYDTSRLSVAGIDAKFLDVSRMADIAKVSQMLLAWVKKKAKETALSIRLDEFALLEADWDGYGASPIEAAALKNARNIWRRLAAGLSAPDVAPNAKGTVSFEWESEKGWAHLEIGNKTFAFYVAAKDAAPISRSRCLPDHEAYLLEAVDAVRQII